MHLKIDAHLHHTFTDTLDNYVQVYMAALILFTHVDTYISPGLNIFSKLTVVLRATLGLRGRAAEDGCDHEAHNQSDSYQQIRETDC